MATVSNQDFFGGGGVRVVIPADQAMQRPQSPTLDRTPEDLVNRLGQNKSSNPFSPFGDLSSGSESIKNNVVNPLYNYLTEVGKATLGPGGHVENLNKISASQDMNAYPGEKGLAFLSEGAKTLLEPVTTTVSAAIKEYSDIISNLKPVQRIAASDAIGKILKEVGNLGQTIEEAKKNHPHVANALDQLITLAPLAVGGGPAVKGLEEGLTTTKEAVTTAGQELGSMASDVASKVGEDVISPAIEKVTTMAEKVKEKLPFTEKVVTEGQKLDAAIQDATPNYEASTPTQKGKLLGRVKEGGVFSGRTVEPTALEKEAGTELAKVEGYDPKATKLTKYQLANEEVVKRAQSLSDSLAKENKIVPKKELGSVVRKAITSVPEESLLLQKSDPVIKNYLRVVKNSLAKVEGTLKGELDLRKTLDDIYENARGKLAFGSDKISALDEVHTAARDALTQDLISRASTDVKASLRSQWNLYRALDQLRIAAEKEAGSSLGRVLDKVNPFIMQGIKGATRAAGFGGAVRLMP